MLLITQPRAGTSHHEILALQIAARERGWDILPAPDGWRLDDDLINTGVVGVPYGSQIFCEVIAQQMNWKLKQNSFDWLANLPHRFLKRRVDFMTLGEAKKITERKFIKPADDKCFDAKVYEVGSFRPPEVIPNDYPVLVSEPVQFDIEYRTFVDGFAVKTWSNYLFHGDVNDPRFRHMVDKDQPYPDHFVFELMTNSHVPYAPCVIDVGIIHGKGMAVIETNPVWASGIYGCDPDGVLDVLEKSCETTF